MFRKLRKHTVDEINEKIRDGKPVLMFSILSERQWKHCYRAWIKYTAKVGDGWIGNNSIDNEETDECIREMAYDDFYYAKDVHDFFQLLFEWHVPGMTYKCLRKFQKRINKLQQELYDEL